MWQKTALRRFPACVALQPRARMFTLGEKQTIGARLDHVRFTPKGRTSELNHAMSARCQKRPEIIRGRRRPVATISD